MRLVAFFAVVGLALVLAWLALPPFLPDDIVRNRYATLAEARADRLFDRGWLPDILPPSAHGIEVNNNLDLNDSWGEFGFAAADWSELSIRLSPPTEASRMFAREIADRLFDGELVGEYADNGYVWVFYCAVREGRCDYSMTPRRERD